MSLHILYRPATFDEVVGNKAIIKSLETVLSRKNPPTSFLFTGPSGTGKTTFARIVKTMLKCADSDFFEMNAADDRGIDAIRTLRKNLQYAAMGGDCKVILLDEAHALTPQSQEALLKIIEDPPPNVYICICTTNPEKLKQTFKRRCHQYELELVNMHTTMKLIRHVLRKEKVSLKQFSKKVAIKITELADGSPGQALKILDMVIDMKDEGEALETIKSIALGAGSPEIIDICRALVSEKSPEVKWKTIIKILKQMKTDGESARRPILGYLNAVALGGNEEAAAMLNEFIAPFYDSGAPGLTAACYRAICIESE